MSMTRKAILALIVSLAWTGSLFAQDQTGRITGRVIDEMSQQAVANASIVVEVALDMVEQINAHLVMKNYDFSRPALLLGFVLGRLLEDYTLLAYKLHGPLFFLTPISLGLIVILIGLFSYPYLRKVITHRFKREVKKA